MFLQVCLWVRREPIGEEGEDLPTKCERGTASRTLAFITGRVFGYPKYSCGKTSISLSG